MKWFFVHDPPEQTFGQKILSSIVSAGLVLIALASFWLAMTGNQARATIALDPIAIGLALEISGAPTNNYVNPTAMPVEEVGPAKNVAANSPPVGTLKVFLTKDFGMTYFLAPLGTERSGVGWRTQARQRLELMICAMKFGNTAPVYSYRQI